MEARGKVAAYRGISRDVVDSHGTSRGNTTVETRGIYRGIAHGIAHGTSRGKSHGGKSRGILLNPRWETAATRGIPPCDHAGSHGKGSRGNSHGIPPFFLLSYIHLAPDGWWAWFVRCLYNGAQASVRVFGKQTVPRRSPNCCVLMHIGRRCVLYARSVGGFNTSVSV